MIKKFLHKLLRIALWVVFILLIVWTIGLGIALKPAALIALAGAVFEGLVLRYVVYPKGKKRV